MHLLSLSGIREIISFLPSCTTKLSRVDRWKITQPPLPPLPPTPPPCDVVEEDGTHAYIPRTRPRRLATTTRCGMCVQFLTKLKANTYTHTRRYARKSLCILSRRALTDKLQRERKRGRGWDEKLYCGYLLLLMLMLFSHT